MANIYEQGKHPGAVIVVPKDGELVVVAEEGQKSPRNPQKKPSDYYNELPRRIRLSDGTILEVFVRSHEINDPLIKSYADVPFHVLNKDGTTWWASGGIMKDGEKFEDPQFTIIHEKA